MSRREWTDAEDRALRRLYRDPGDFVSIREIAESMGRSDNSVRCHARRMGLEMTDEARSKMRENLFWRYVEKTDDCWVWRGHRSPDGYGQVTYNGRIRRAHRVAWELEHGSVPDDLCVCHACDNPLCVNTSHLWVGTHAANARDRAQKGRSADRRGERSPAAVLTKDDVKEIRRRRSRGETYRSITSDFEVSKAAVIMADKGDTWSHV